jgi:hypothetical protein
MTKEEMKEMVGKLTVDEILQLDDILNSAKNILRMFNPLFDLNHKISKEIELKKIREKRKKEYQDRLNERMGKL